MIMHKLGAIVIGAVFALIVEYTLDVKPKDLLWKIILHRGLYVLWGFGIAII